MNDVAEEDKMIPVPMWAVEQMARYFRKNFHDFDDVEEALNEAIRISEQSTAPSGPSTAGDAVTIDRDVAYALKWIMHDMDARVFVSTAEDHRSIVRTSAKELRVLLEAALAADGRY